MDLINFSIFISEISNPTPMFLFIFFISVFLYFIQKKYLSFLIISSSLLSMSITTSLKLLFKIPRPENAILLMQDYRFPSGHATMSAVISAFFIYIIFKSKINIYLKTFFYFLAFSWFLLVSYARLHLGVHYLIDVLVGGIIGFSVVFILTRFLNRNKFVLYFSK
jgi:undecaprenyl-diphosphatase